MEHTKPSGNHIDAGDVLIVGAGLAGLFTALKLAPMPVTVLAGAPIGDGASSAWAQGGIAAAVEEGDTPQSHAEDTIAAGAGIVDEAVALAMVREAPDRIKDLLRLGVPFDRDLTGKLSLGREAAHSHRRIVRVNGDRAGHAIMAALAAAVRATPSIRVMAGLSSYELALAHGRVVGIYARPSDGIGTPTLVTARAIVLASGGVGQLFAVTTNPREAKAEGLAMAARAGAVTADTEFVQFHPTALAGALDPAPLVTEALRGEGAILINEHGRRFMPDVHTLAELAPRDIVARAIFREIEAGHRVYLDARGSVGARFPEAFPTVTAHCQAIGIDPVRHPIPVAPAAHYHMGGIKTDMQGRTNLEGLWACGEVASTGAHGANRLASNSLLEAVVYGARIADDIRGMKLGATTRAADIASPEISGTSLTPGSFIAKLRELMTNHVGVIRTRNGLVHALEGIAQLERDVGTSTTFLNQLTSAKLIAAAALRRGESRGGHFRSDFPELHEMWRHRSFLTLVEANTIIMQVKERRKIDA